MRKDIVPVVPSDLAQQIGKMLQNVALEAKQEKSYRGDYANGDRMYVQERTHIRVYEVKP